MRAALLIAILGSFEASAATYEYKLPATNHPDVIADRNTELWARVMVPEGFSGPRPVVIALHGNHATCGSGAFPRVDRGCTYTTTGACPSGNVAPSHAGYDYVGSELAKQGYIFVSVNANLGITCGSGTDDDPSLNMARGRLVLKHLEALSNWNRGQQTADELLQWQPDDISPAALASDLRGKVDLQNIGLIGHSRGGEGMRAALNLLRDVRTGWIQKIGLRTAVKALYEIAPVDGQSRTVLNPEGVAWNVLLPACDGDVRNLQGMRVFDRMNALPFGKNEDRKTPKSVLFAWGMNHNFFNTEWQTSDSSSCRDHLPLFPSTNGSEAQQKLVVETLVPFMKAHVGVGADPALSKMFDPRNPLPTAVSSLTTVDRSYIPYAGRNYNRLLLGFSWNIGTVGWDIRPTVSLVQSEHRQVPGHEGAVRGGTFAWTQGSLDTFAEYQLSDEEGRDFIPEEFVEFRVTRVKRSTPDPLNFSIQLVAADGTKSRTLELKNYVTVMAPAGGHSLLQTVSIPVADFQTAGKQRSIRFTFDRSSNEVAIISQVYLREPHTAGIPTPSDIGLEMVRDAEEISRMIRRATQAMIIRKGKLDGVEAKMNFVLPGVLAKPEKEFNLRFKVDEDFEVRSSMLTLAIGQELFQVSGFPVSDDLGTIEFKLTEEQYSRLKPGSKAMIFYDSSPDAKSWDLGVWSP
jgi:hypothetical protein